MIVIEKTNFEILKTEIIKCFEYENSITYL